ncbi:MAG TPA: YbhB/YbcL family Raf kinase inhibitor-like protein [Rhizomicrobium sp.]|jgi:hypothetical protein
MVRTAGKAAFTLYLTLSGLWLSNAAAQTFELTSPDFANGAKLSLAQVNSRCGGRNGSPALRWSGAPPKTKSYALTVFDPDAGGGAGFWHWLIFDIPANASQLPEGAGSGKGLSQGIKQIANDFGGPGYGGACPPPGSGIHHYQFTLYALGIANLPAGIDSSSSGLAAYFKSHALATAVLTGIYSR